MNISIKQRLNIRWNMLWQMLCTCFFGLFQCKTDVGQKQVVWVALRFIVLWLVYQLIFDRHVSPKSDFAHSFSSVFGWSIVTETGKMMTGPEIDSQKHKYNFI